MRILRSTSWVVLVWLLVLGLYTVASLFLPGAAARITFGNVVLCVLPLVANAGLLLNAVSPYRRRNAFWMLLALGCTIWMAAQLLWTYYELGLHRSVMAPFVGDAVFYLHLVPMIGALVVQPHARKVGETLRYGYLDTLLLGLCALYLYVFFVIPWGFVEFRLDLYAKRLMQMYFSTSFILIAGLVVLALRTQGVWRKIYFHLLGATSLSLVGSGVMYWRIYRGNYGAGSLFDLPTVASFLWFGTAGVIAFRLSPVPESAQREHAVDPSWPAGLARAGLLAIPLFAVWDTFLSSAPWPVREFRLWHTLLAIFLGTALVFLRQHLVDRERMTLLRDSQESVENLRRLQMQFVQAEKLASLGQLAAGAAHEINNPLTAILGYSELMVEDPAASEVARTLAEKIREQARRTRSLVNNLLSFARQVPAEKSLIDISAVVASAIELRTLDLRDRNIRIQFQKEPSMPLVRGDPNQLLQVFYNIINNAVDALDEVGGGILTIRGRRDHANVVVEFHDTGAGIKEPELVFDPFYTTKPVGKGTGLGLSICYGIVKEHGGHILCYNHEEGGATFRVELPAVLAPFPQRQKAVAPASSTAPVTKNPS